MSSMLSLNKDERLMIAKSRLDSLINTEKELMLLKEGIPALDAKPIIESLMDLAQKKQAINNEIDIISSEL
jgi:hypothetical protein